MRCTTTATATATAAAHRTVFLLTPLDRLILQRSACIARIAHVFKMCMCALHGLRARKHTPAHRATEHSTSCNYILQLCGLYTRTNERVLTTPPARSA